MSQQGEALPRRCLRSDKQKGAEAKLGPSRLLGTCPRNWRIDRGIKVRSRPDFRNAPSPRPSPGPGFGRRFGIVLHRGAPLLTTPIIIDARGDLLVFASLGAAERELTPEAVRSGAYTAAYDRSGRRLRLEVRSHERRFLGVFREVQERVHIVPVEHIPTQQEALAALLARFLAPGASLTTGALDRRVR